MAQLTTHILFLQQNKCSELEQWTHFGHSVTVMKLFQTSISKKLGLMEKQQVGNQSATEITTSQEISTAEQKQFQISSSTKPAHQIMLDFSDMLKAAQKLKRLHLLILKSRQQVKMLVQSLDIAKVQSHVAKLLTALFLLQTQVQTHMLAELLALQQELKQKTKLQCVKLKMLL